jgi:glycerol-3-phosphate cytidylyltransferase
MIDGKRVGFTASAFDLLHAGHVAMLKEAKNQCDYLIAGLHSDPTLDRAAKNSPVQSIVERQLQLEGCKYVDEIWIYNTEKDLEDLLLILPIDVRILGVEYEGKEFTGREICHKRNIELYFNGRDHSFSSSELRQRVHSAEAAKIKK